MSEVALITQEQWLQGECITQNVNEQAPEYKYPVCVTQYRILYLDTQMIQERNKVRQCNFMRCY